MRSYWNFGLSHLSADCARDGRIATILTGIEGGAADASVVEKCIVLIVLVFVAWCVERQARSSMWVSVHVVMVGGLIVGGLVVGMHNLSFYLAGCRDNRVLSFFAFRCMGLNGHTM